ncbi:MAG: rod shape-determining protein MreC [Spirochaetales bacterium]|nr:rod shape-determining protein MreC [Spirochaetales bacterium]
MRKLSGFFVKYKKLLTLVFLIAVSMLMVLLSETPAVSAVNQVGLTVVSFFQRIATSAAQWLGDSVNSIGKLGELKKELSDTQRELLEYKKASQDNVILREKVEALSRELGLARDLDYAYIPAEIIAWGTQTDFSTIVINKGAADRVAKDMPVVAFSGGTMGLVGKIGIVGSASAVVYTILDPNCFVSALFKDTRYKGIVSGLGASTDYVEMDLVTKSAVDELRPGAILVTSGLGGLFPKEIPIGRWREGYEAKDYESVVKLRITPILNFQKIEYLYVLKVEDRP